MNYKKLLIPLFIVLFLFLSWLSPYTRFLWDSFDHKGFYFLNSWVQTSTFWQNFWAFTGHRAMDWIHDLIMLLFFLFNIMWASRQLKMRKVAELIFSCAFIALIIHIVNGSFFTDFIHILRSSPTLEDTGAFRLSHVIEWTKVKDHSRRSFPSDHAVTAILFTCLSFHLLGRKIGFISIPYAIFFCLPRLIAGAHWITDIVIGSVSIALITTSLAFGTPFANTCINVIERTIRKICLKSMMIIKSS